MEATLSVQITTFRTDPEAGRKSDDLAPDGEQEHPTLDSSLKWDGRCLLAALPTLFFAARYGLAPLLVNDSWDPAVLAWFGVFGALGTLALAVRFTDWGASRKKGRFVPHKRFGSPGLAARWPNAVPYMLAFGLLGFFTAWIAAVQCPDLSDSPIKRMIWDNEGTAADRALWEAAFEAYIVPAYPDAPAHELLTFSDGSSAYLDEYYEDVQLVALAFRMPGLIGMAGFLSFGIVVLAGARAEREKWTRNGLKALLASEVKLGEDGRFLGLFGSIEDAVEKMKEEFKPRWQWRRYPLVTAVATAASFLGAHAVVTTDSWSMTHEVQMQSWEQDAYPTYMGPWFTLFGRGPVTALTCTLAMVYVGGCFLCIILGPYLFSTRCLKSNRLRMVLLGDYLEELKPTSAADLEQWTELRAFVRRTTMLRDNAAGESGVLSGVLLMLGVSLYVLIYVVVCGQFGVGISGVFTVVFLPFIMGGVLHMLYLTATVTAARALHATQLRARQRELQLELLGRAGGERAPTRPRVDDDVIKAAIAAIDYIIATVEVEPPEEILGMPITSSVIWTAGKFCLSSLVAVGLRMLLA